MSASGSSLDSAVSTFSRGGDGCPKLIVINKKPKRRRRRNKRTTELLSNHQSRPRFRPFPFAAYLSGHSMWFLLVLVHLTGYGARAETVTLPSSILSGADEVTESGPPFRPSTFLPLAPSPPPPAATPCDRSRKVFTSASGEISDGPTGANYTQVKPR